MWKKYFISGEATIDNITRRMYIACCLPKATNTHTQNGNSGCTNMPPCYMYIVFHVINCLLCVKLYRTLYNLGIAVMSGDLNFDTDFWDIFYIQYRMKVMSVNTSIYNCNNFIVCFTEYF